MSDHNASWRSELLSEEHGMAAIALADAHVEAANEAARRLFGDACVGMELDELFDADGAVQVRELIARGVMATVEVGSKREGARRALLFVPLPPGGILLTRPAEEHVPRRSGIIETQLRRPDEPDELRPVEPPVAGDVSVIVADTIAELPESDVSALLHTIALEAQALTHADYVAIGIGCDPTKPFNPWISVGMSRRTAEQIGRVPRPVGLLGVVARGGELVRIPDVHRDPRFGRLPAHHPDVASFLGVPIEYRGKSVGNLYLATKPGHRALSAEDERKIRALAASAGAAIETASLYVSEKRHRAWLRNVIDHIPHAVLLYDEQGKLVATNQACAAICCAETCVDKFGNPIALDIRMPDGRAFDVDELPMVRAFETHAATFRQEASVRTRDGRMVPVSISAVPVRDPRGNVTGVATIIEDISERKCAERMREEWTAIIAHDLRQPVGVISLGADLLLKLHGAEWSDRDRRIVDRIRTAAGLLARMISDLTDASLIESRQLSLQLELVSLDALVHSVIESLDAIGAGFDVRVRVQGERQAWIDPDRIRQVLGNLVSNAEKYGRPRTSIYIDVLGRPDEIELVVTNEGPGIPSDQIPKLFSRFERARHARESRTAGLGLGLYIAKGIVEAHGGRIWAESVPDRTTSFHVVLPRARPEGEGEASSSGA